MRKMVRLAITVVVATLLTVAGNGAQPGTSVNAATGLAPQGPGTVYSYFAYIPAVVSPPFSCPLTSSSSYGLIPFYGGTWGGPYKGNRLTDQNADFRLSILGFEPVSGGLEYVTMNGDGGDPDSPTFQNMFVPPRFPTFVQVSQVYQWTWNEAAPAPYGARNGLNPDWGGHTVLDLQTTQGETIDIPGRNASINASYKAMVLFATDNELTIAYFPYDNVLLLPSITGYVVHMLNFCVDPNLVALYRAQLDGSGKRSTMQLPVILSNQAVGNASGSSITVAIRDGARYMDPRDKHDWWRGKP